MLRREAIKGLLAAPAAAWAILSGESEANEDSPFRASWGYNEDGIMVARVEEDGDNWPKDGLCGGKFESCTVTDSAVTYYGGIIPDWEVFLEGHQRAFGELMCHIVSCWIYKHDGALFGVRDGAVWLTLNHCVTFSDAAPIDKTS